MTWIKITLIYLPFAILWLYLRNRKPQVLSTNREPKPLPVTSGPIGWLKALVCWLFLFARTFSVPPGIYYLGQDDPDSPLLVTGNFYLTLFSLYRALRNSRVRILVIDTGGINVWCAAGKGQFSADEIVDKLQKCHLLDADGSIKLILPRFSLSGVNLKKLKEAGVNPAVGPLYADEIPAYLARNGFRHYSGTRVRFGIGPRFYTAVPTTIQFLFYFTTAYIASLGWLHPVIIPIAAGLAFVYPLLFPYLPGHEFALKGLSLGLLTILPTGIYAWNAGLIQPWLPYLLFIVATCLFIGLSYTGNSPISNYTLVRKEIARYLPVVVILYITAFIFEIYLRW